MNEFKNLHTAFWSKNFVFVAILFSLFALSGNLMSVNAQIEAQTVQGQQVGNEMRYGPFYATSQGWQTTGMRFKKGQSFRVEASGKITGKEGETLGPYQGTANWRWRVLCGKLGTKGVEIGGDGPMTAWEDGVLLLGVPKAYDFNPNDPDSATTYWSGAFTVYIYLALPTTTGSGVGLIDALLVEDCPTELIAGELPSKPCTVCITSWDKNSSEMVRVDLPNSDSWGNHPGGVVVFTTNQASPYDWSGRTCSDPFPNSERSGFPWGMLVSAAQTVPPGEVTVPIVVSQKGVGKKELYWTVTVIPRGGTTSANSGQNVPTPPPPIIGNPSNTNRSNTNTNKPSGGICTGFFILIAGVFCLMVTIGKRKPF